MGVKIRHARIHGETAVLAKKNIFLSVVTPTFVDGVFVAQCIHTYMMNVRDILVWESVIFSENPSPLSHSISSPTRINIMIEFLL